MSHAAAIHVPAETDWLCEGCGYVLNGLPPGGNCPECGKPTGESSPELRQLPAWERPEAGWWPMRFIATSAAVIFRPTRFYRSFATRGSRAQSIRFARIHWILSAMLFGIAGWIHADWFLDLGPTLKLWAQVPWYAIILLALVAYGFLVFITRIAARLTSFEATMRGLRLPVDVVRRGMDYHAAHYLPVALLTLGTVLGYRIVLGHSVRLMTWGPMYLYTLCGLVIVAAAYLFKTYWIGMRNMMYASR
ncbi:MAG TPA: hypothetical protein VGI81_14760 [Tepidisphaeraceae bacterium]|jgi:hypothetical protein